MTSLRTLLLALLMIVLPIRGVMSAALLCPPAAGAASVTALAAVASGSGASAPAPEQAHPHDHPHDHQHHNQHEHEHRHAPGHGPAGDLVTPHGHVHDPGHDDHAVAAGSPHGSASAHHDGGSGAGSCNLCSACCSVPPLASAPPVLPPPPVMPALRYPVLGVPAPSFVSDGLERPPRRG